MARLALLLGALLCAAAVFAHPHHGGKGKHHGGKGKHHGGKGHHRGHHRGHHGDSLVVKMISIGDVRPSEGSVRNVALSLGDEQLVAPSADEFPDGWQVFSHGTKFMQSYGYKRGDHGDIYGDQEGIVKHFPLAGRTGRAELSFEFKFGRGRENADRFYRVVLHARGQHKRLDIRPPGEEGWTRHTVSIDIPAGEEGEEGCFDKGEHGVWCPNEGKEGWFCKRNCPKPTASYDHTECSQGNAESPQGRACNLVDGPLTWADEPACERDINGFQAEGRCWQATLAEAQAICDRHVECAGVTRDNAGYEPRGGKPSHHVAAHEMWLKASSTGANCGNIFAGKKSCEGAAQGANYGTQPDPKTCGMLAAADGYSIVMFSPEYSAGENNWGCRACADPSGATLHEHWNLYSIRECTAHTAPEIQLTEQPEAEDSSDEEESTAEAIAAAGFKFLEQPAAPCASGYEDDGSFRLCVGDSDCTDSNNFCAEGKCNQASKQCEQLTPQIEVSKAGVSYFIPAALIRAKCLHFLLFAVIMLFGLAWGFCERRRRREALTRPARTGGYVSGLFDIFSFRYLRVCLPACVFTPVLAAFNRAEADDRECTGCDVCFAVVKPMSQYTTRQTIRGKYGLADSTCADCLAAFCCTPCAVGQDSIELERRQAVEPVVVVAAGPVAEPVPPAYELVEMSKVEAAHDQV